MRLAWSVVVAAWCLQSCGDNCRRIADLDFVAPPPSVYPSTLVEVQGGFAVFGDTQRTSWQECIIGREVNDAETAQLIAAVVEAQPDFIVAVGDLVFHGADEEHWEFFDYIATPIRDAQIPLLPAAGNHEYWGSNDAAIANMRARFTQLQGDPYYLERYGPLALVVIDTNIGELQEVDEGIWARQAAWFDATMTELSADPEVEGILVFGHHPPYTNSVIVEDDEDVQETFVPAFCESSKSLAFITGHAHGYEHFIRGEAEGCGGRDKHFIVTAGGGGPRPDSLRSSDESGHVDTYTGPSPRPFNYLWMVPTETGLSVDVRGFQRGESELRSLESFQLFY